jgi:hypothetical protein
MKKIIKYIEYNILYKNWIISSALINQNKCQVDFIDIILSF